MRLTDEQISFFKKAVWNDENPKEAWKHLTNDHFIRLRDSLANVAMYEMLDRIMIPHRSKTFTTFFNDDFIAHYDDGHLSLIEVCLEDAQKGIDYITELIRAEKRKRETQKVPHKDKPE